MKQPKYKLIKTGFLPLVSPSHSISPNLVGVFYIGITPHEGSCGAFCQAGADECLLTS